MRRIADIGAAVIGTGFIGTVHVEAAPPDRRPGPRRARQHAGARRRRGPTRSACRAPTPSLEELLADPPVDVVHVTSPNHLHYPQASADPRRRPPRRLREAAGDDRRRVRGAGRPGRGERASSTRSTSTSASTRSTSTSRELIAAAASATSASSPATTSRTGCSTTPTGTGASSRSKGGALRAVGDIGSHWLDLIDLRDRPADRARSWPTSRPSSRSASEPRGPVETFSTGARRRDGRRARSRPRTSRRSCCASTTARAASVAVSPDQRRPQELARSARSTARPRRPPGTRRRRTICGSAIATGRTRSCSRNPALMSDAGRPRRRCPAATSRASPTRSARSSARSTRTSLAGRPPTDPPYATFADGHDEMLVGDAVAESARAGRWVDVAATTSRPPAPVPRLHGGRAR